MRTLDVSDLATCPDCMTTIEEGGDAPGCLCSAPCWPCGRQTKREQLRTVDGRPCCQGCAAGDDGPSDGVPVAVDEDEASCARTVKLEVDPGVRETGLAWAERLTREGAAA